MCPQKYGYDYKTYGSRISETEKPFVFSGKAREASQRF